MSDSGKRVTIKGTVHVLIVLAGWALFAYWWNRVIPQIDSRDLAVALAFGGTTALATVVTTLLWVRYNLGIFRRKGPRKRLVQVTENHATDVLGRKILRPGPGNLKTVRYVVVSVDAETKKYDAAEAQV